MSRRPTQPQRPRVPIHSSDNNPYQPTTVDSFPRHQPSRRSTHHGTTTCNHCVSDTDTYYEYYPDDVFRPASYSPTNKEYFFTDDSGSTRLPHYEEISLKRNSRNVVPRTQQVAVKNGKVVSTVVVPHKDVRRVYPKREGECERVYHEVHDLRSSSESNPTRREPPRSRLSDRPQSSQSSGVASAIVDGCGGRCQTFENVCYYFLQVAFTMGVLIGTSLCIAGAVLRKSAARNLQVLVYIGAMLSLVSALLLGVQCSARNAARKRRKALRGAKRAPIPMDTLHRVPVVVDQPLQRTTTGHQGTLYQQRPMVVTSNPLVEHQGIPWWRRKDAV